MPKTDTSPAAAEAQAGALRRLAPQRRLELAVEMSLATRALLVARLRAERPDWPEVLVRGRALRLILAGSDLPPQPNDGG